MRTELTSEQELPKRANARTLMLEPISVWKATDILLDNRANDRTLKEEPNSAWWIKLNWQTLPTMV
jgi:hypothetical protein